MHVWGGARRGGRAAEVGANTRVTRVTRRPLGARALWLLASALQLLLPGAAAWADARLDIAGAHAAPHVESHTSKSCARIHAPDCAVCHFLTAPAVPARPSALRLNVADGWRLYRAVPAGLPHPLARPHPQPRAP